MELLGKVSHARKLLQQLNPNVAFDRAGVEIVVANAQREHLPRKVARVKGDATTQRVLAYDRVDRWWQSTLQRLAAESVRPLLASSRPPHWLKAS